MKKVAFICAFLGSVICMSQVAHAELTATPLPGDARLVEFEYDADNTFLVLARPKSVTHIEFGNDERVMTVAGGDTKNWELSPTQNKKHLFVKPIFEAIETSMTVITDKRTYQFVLRSTGPGAKWYQRITWRYGQTMLLDARAEEEREFTARAKASEDKAKAVTPESQTLSTGIKPEALRFGYVIDGTAPFRPASVFDDGKFTWIRMPSDLTELPALFASVEGEELAVVNYVIKGQYILAQRLMDEGVLKLGKQEVRFSRKKPAAFFSFGEGN